MDFYVVLLFWALFGLIGIGMAQKKGIHPALGFLAGMLLGPLVFLIGFVKHKPQIKKCPQCAETVKFEAVVCKHCQYKFPAPTQGA